MRSVVRTTKDILWALERYEELVDKRVHALAASRATANSEQEYLYARMKEREGEKKFYNKVIDEYPDLTARVFKIDPTRQFIICLNPDETINLGATYGDE